MRCDLFHRLENDEHTVAYIALYVDDFLASFATKKKHVHISAISKSILASVGKVHKTNARVIKAVDVQNAHLLHNSRFARLAGAFKVQFAFKSKCSHLVDTFGGRNGVTCSKFHLDENPSPCNILSCLIKVLLPLRLMPSRRSLTVRVYSFFASLRLTCVRLVVDDLELGDSSPLSSVDATQKSIVVRRHPKETRSLSKTLRQECSFWKQPQNLRILKHFIRIFVREIAFLFYLLRTCAPTKHKGRAWRRALKVALLRSV